MIKPYKIRYSVEFGDFGKNEIQNGKQGLTHKIILISCIEQPSGAYSQKWIAFDGIKKDNMSNKDAFKAWILMGKTLAEKKDLYEWQKFIAECAFDMFKKIIFGDEESCLEKDCSIGENHGKL